MLLLCVKHGSIDDSQYDSQYDSIVHVSTNLPPGSECATLPSSSLPADSPDCARASPRYTPSSSTPSLASIQALSESPTGPSGVVPASAAAADVRRGHSQRIIIAEMHTVAACSSDGAMMECDRRRRVVAEEDRAECRPSFEWDCISLRTTSTGGGCVVVMFPPRSLKRQGREGDVRRSFSLWPMGLSRVGVTVCELCARWRSKRLSCFFPPLPKLLAASLCLVGLIRPIPKPFPPSFPRHSTHTTHPRADGFHPRYVAQRNTRSHRPHPTMAMMAAHCAVTAGAAMGRPMGRSAAPVAARASSCAPRRLAVSAAAAADAGGGRTMMARSSAGIRGAAGVGGLMVAPSRRVAGSGGGRTAVVVRAAKKKSKGSGGSKKSAEEKAAAKEAKEAEEAAAAAAPAAAAAADADASTEVEGVEGAAGEEEAATTTAAPPRATTSSSSKSSKSSSSSSSPPPLPRPKTTASSKQYRSVQSAPPVEEGIDLTLVGAGAVVGLYKC
jgi:hypothetical protein